MNIMKFHSIVYICLLCCSLGFLASCDTKPTSTENAKRGIVSDTPVVLAAVAPFEINGDLLKHGFQLAAEKINSSGGLLGRPILVQYYDDEANVEKGLSIARTIIQEPNVIAVLGHMNSPIAIPASTLYEHANILMLTPGSTAPELTQRGYRRIFRLIPSDTEIGQHVVHHANKLGYNNFVILHSQDAYGIGLANTIDRVAAELSLNISDRRSYTSINKEELTTIIAPWKENPPDAIFALGLLPEIGHVVRELREAGFNQPILGGDTLNTMRFIRLAGEAANGCTTGNIYDPADQRDVVTTFQKQFKQMHGVEPDARAAQGYDTLTLLADAVEAAGSLQPEVIANHLREMEAWEGVTGMHAFRYNGEIEGKQLVVKQVVDGQFKVVSN
jgi:branched-chain amino acid transport system substrate-binding protein